MWPRSHSFAAVRAIGQHPVQFPRFLQCVAFLRTRSLLCIFNFASSICVDSPDLFFLVCLGEVVKFPSVRSVVGSGGFLIGDSPRLCLFLFAYVVI